jgi:hypothetical protein
MRQPYNIKTVSYTEGAEIDVYPETYQILIVNQGGDAATINGFLLKPFPPGFPDLVGSSLSLDCNENELYDDILVLVFLGTGTAPLVQVIQQFYKKADR